MDNDDEEQQFRSLWKKRQEKLRGIIAVKGLPFTAKMIMADYIGEWAKCPVLCIQHFLDGNDKKAIADALEELDIQVGDERHRQLLIQHAFRRLCKIAKFHLSRGDNFHGNSTVVIKSRLNSTFELDRLIELVRYTYTGSHEKYPLLIIDSRPRNEFKWRNHFEYTKHYNAQYIEDEVMRSWYSPASWNEMEDLIVRDHDYQAKWDLHFQQLLLKASHHAPIVVRRLMVDPSGDETINRVDYCLSYIFDDAIKYLLTAPQQELIDNFQNPYTLDYCELRPYLLEKRLSAAESEGRKKYLCARGDCVFRYSKELKLHQDDDDKAASASSNSAYCGVCEEQVVSEMPTYTCRLCTLTLHKSCAERVDFKALRKFDINYLTNCYLDHNLPHKYACSPFVNAGKDFDVNCRSCLFQTHLKCVPLPTIINHDSFPHFLSLQLTKKDYDYRACGESTQRLAYCCSQCAWFYHLKCAFLPLELLKYEHGGHEHVMKLMYTLHEDGMEQEETLLV